MSEFSIKDIGCLFSQIWRNKWFVLFVTLSGTLAGLALTVNHEPETRFRATASVCVTYTTYQEQMRGSSVITNYSDIITSRLVCERAVELLANTGFTSSDIQEMVDNWISSNSYVMFINATAGDQQLAIRVANAVAQAFTEKASSISGNNSLQILDAAHITATLADRMSNIIFIMALGSFLFACAFILLREIYSGKTRFLYQCAEDRGELLGILPDMK